MSSTNKTDSLGLNQWIGSDVPSHTDFNNDNAIIDSAIKNHIANSVAHTSSTEKATWNEPYHFGVYYGDGTSKRTINTNCDFEPSWGVIFPIDIPATRIDFANNQHYNYSAFFTTDGGTMGAQLDKKNLIVQQNSVPTVWNELKSLNVKGVAYVFIAFR